MPEGGANLWRCINESASVLMATSLRNICETSDLYFKLRYSALPMANIEKLESYVRKVELTLMQYLIGYQNYEAPIPRQTPS